MLTCDWSIKCWHVTDHVTDQSNTDTWPSNEMLTHDWPIKCCQVTDQSTVDMWPTNQMLTRGAWAKNCSPHSPPSCGPRPCLRSPGRTPHAFRLTCNHHQNVHISRLLKRNNLFYTFYYPFWEIGAALPGKATAATRAEQHSPTSACWVFSCFCNPPNCDMDYRIFNLRMWSFVCMCIDTGGWAHRRVSTTFLTRGKLSQLFLVLLTGFEPWVFGSRVCCSTNWAYRPFPDAKGKVVQSCGYWSWGVRTSYHYQGTRSSWMRSGFTHMRSATSNVSQ